MPELDILSSRAIIGTYYEALEQDTGAAWIEMLSWLNDTSDQETEDYPWLGQVPVMRKLVGGRQAKGLSAYKYSITNEEFEATLEILKKHLRRDKSGQTLVRIAELAEATNTHWAQLISDLIMNGATTPCYDGKFFFDTTHEEGESGVQSNMIDSDISLIPAAQHGTILKPSVEEMAESIFDGITQMMGFKNDQGQPMNEGAQEFLVMVPIGLSKAAFAAVTNKTLESGKVNSLVESNFKISVAANARLGWTTEFLVNRTDAALKSFIRQEEVKVEFSAIAEGSELEFNKRVHHYGVYASRAAGYGLWQRSVKVKLV